MNKHRKGKNVYILKHSPTEIDEKHKELQTKSVYLLKADDHVVTKYSDIVYDFIDENNGLFLIVSDDKTFYNYFRKSFYKELRIDQERIRLSANRQRALKEIRIYEEHKHKPLLFLESKLDGQSALPFLEELKSEFKDLLVILLMDESGEEKIAQCVEAGADSCITKPVSVNVLIEKVANTLVPPDEIGKKIREGKMRLRKVEFALAYGVARDILEMKPGSPAGLLIMGDALKGLSKREDGLKMYLQAVENAPTYLEPLKKIVDFYKEENDKDNELRYLLRMDDLSPLHVERKKEIGEILFTKGETKKAAGYFADAVKLTHEQRLPECVKLAAEYQDKIFKKEDTAAERLLSQATRLARIYKAEAHWSWYNRLGMLLRRRKCIGDAIKAYSEAAKRAPKDASILFNLGMAYVENKDMGAASEKFERAIKLDPALYKDNIEAAYIMGQVFLRATRMKNATVMFNHVKNIDPNYKKIQALLDSMQKPKKKK